jgi:flagellar biosynthesis protein FlhG
LVELSSWSGDQADGLRRLFGYQAPQVVAFASGREACGRTTLVVQTAAALAATGRSVVIIDENPAPDNTPSAFGVHARYDLLQLLRNEKTLSQVALAAAPLVRIVPAARAARELGRLGASGEERLLTRLREIQRGADFVLIDCAIRRGDHLSPLARRAGHIALVVAAQGSAITHSYALIKRIAQDQGRDQFQLVVTRARAGDEAQAIYDNMRRVARERLGVRLDYLGASPVPVTDHLAEALLQRLPPLPAEFDETAVVPRSWAMAPEALDSVL